MKLSEALGTLLVAGMLIFVLTLAAGATIGGGGIDTATAAMQRQQEKTARYLAEQYTKQVQAQEETERTRLAWEGLTRIAALGSVVAVVLGGVYVVARMRKPALPPMPPEVLVYLQLYAQDHVKPGNVLAVDYVDGEWCVVDDKAQTYAPIPLLPPPKA